MGVISFFKSLFGKKDQPIQSTPTVAPLTFSVSDLVIGGLVGSICGLLISAIETSSETHYSLRSPKHSTFKINLYKYGTVKRKKQIFAFVANKHTPLRKLGWQIH